MMMQVVHPPEQAAPLFAGWEETLLWSCLQGVMGKVYAPAGEPLRAALAVLGDFTFLAGEPRADLAAFAPPECRRGYRLLLPQSEGWARCIQEVYGPRARRITRYATKKDPAAFHRAHLTRLAGRLLPGDALRPIQGQLYHRCLADPWSRDLVAQFPTEGDYARLGLGVAVVRQGELVAGASSYARYRTGIEIEVDTRPDCRRQGLATAASAALLLRCLDRGLYPSWDAHTPTSLALAEKLGYGFSHGYVAYELEPVSNPQYPTKR